VSVVTGRCPDRGGGPPLRAGTEERGFRYPGRPPGRTLGFLPSSSQACSRTRPG
jgi:hypothetical protein